MLKYEIPHGSLGEDNIKLDLFSIASYDYYADDSKVEVRNIYENDLNLYNGETVMVVTTLDKEDDYGNRQPIRFSDEVSVITHDNLLKKFSFIGDKYIPLKITSLSIEVEDMVLYLHFSFDSWHYFNRWDDYGIQINVTYPSTNGNANTITFSNCQYVMDTELKWRYKAGLESIDNFMCSIFRNDTYECVGYGDYNSTVVDEKYVEVNEIPESACFTDEMYLKKKVFYAEDCWRYELYDKSCNDGTLFGVSVNRENFKYKNVNMTEEYVVVPLTSVSIPISSSTGNNLYQEQNINESFVESQVEKAKNGFVEMEKHVFHPVFKTDSGYKPIRKIKFNLHFRERDDNGWIVKQNGYWNGMNSKGLCGNVGDSNTFQYFSYNDSYIEDDKGRQSDLLSYLGFTDSDVKYQKSKLKKSFLRLSFFDSKNRAKQNLLCYSTVFVDSGNLFAKMMRGSNKKGAYVKSNQVGDDRYDNLKVDTEPIFKNNTSVEIVEESRLSSQIVITDRFSGKCSEGFYLYLWADNDNGKVPSDIYMRVEFNHAGYGRIIPFTMPYFTDNNTNTSRIYTFSEISDQWLNNNGWGVRKNEMFSYIHFKYVYDEGSNQRVYYLDGDTYGMGSYFDDTSNELELNLYEPKITFETTQANTNIVQHNGNVQS